MVFFIRSLLVTWWHLLFVASDAGDITNGCTKERTKQQFSMEAAFIINDFLKDNVRTVTLYTTDNNGSIRDLFISCLHLLTTKPVYVLNKNVEYSDSQPWQSTAFIIISDSRDLKVFIDSLKIASQHPLWKSWSEVIFIDTNFTLTDNDFAYTLLKTSWKMYESLNSLSVSMDMSSCVLEKYVVLKHFNSFLSAGKIVTGTKNTMLFSNGNGYPFRLPAHNYPPFMYEVTRANGEKTLGGIVGDFSEILVKKTNITLVTHMNSLTDLSQWVLPNSFFVESLDITYPFSILQYDNLQESGYPYLLEKAVLIVPKAQQLPKWMVAVMPFHFQLWVLYLSCYPILIALGRVYSCLLAKDTHNVLNSIEIFRLLFLGMVNFQIATPWFRFFLISVMFFNMVMNNAYSGSFTSYMTVPQYYPDFNTFDEIASKGLSVALPLHFGSNIDIDISSFVYRADLSDEITGKIIPLIKFVDTVEDGLRNAIMYRKLSVTYFSIGANYELSKRDYYLDNRPLLHIMDESIFNLYVVVQYRKSCPLVKYTDYFMSYLTDSGIPGKVVSDWSARVALSNKKLEGTLMPLSMKHLESSFYILTLGYLASVVAIVVELIWFKVISILIIVF